MAADRDPRNSLRYRLRYWSSRPGTLLLRGAERLVTGRAASLATRSLAIRPSARRGESVEACARRDAATVLHYPAPEGLPDWLVREAAVDATWSYALRDARLAPESGAVWLADGTPVPEVFGGVSRYAGSQDVRGLARRRPSEALAGTWGALASHTYYHFLTEDLPALLASLAFAREVLGVDAGIVTPHARSRFVSDALGTFAATVHSTHSARVSVERLVASGFNSSLLHPSSIESLRSHFGVSEEPGRRLLYVSRRGFRRSLTWEGDLVQALMHRLPELEIVEGHRWPLAEQVAAFSEAAVVIGPHGAGLSNLVFSPRSTQVIEIGTQENCNDHFWRISALRGHRYTMAWVGGDDNATTLADRLVDLIQ